MPESVAELQQSPILLEVRQRAQHLLDNVKLFAQIRGFSSEGAGTRYKGKAAGMDFVLTDTAENGTTLTVRFDRLRSLVRKRRRNRGVCSYQRFIQPRQEAFGRKKQKSCRYIKRSGFSCISR